ncbi:MAG: hypothetical protein ABII90_07445 [Bacteroidota bacterium]
MKKKYEIYEDENIFHKGIDLIEDAKVTLNGYINYVKKKKIINEVSNYPLFPLFSLFPLYPYFPYTLIPLLTGNFSFTKP